MTPPRAGKEESQLDISEPRAPQTGLLILYQLLLAGASGEAVFMSAWKEVTDPEERRLILCRLYIRERNLSCGSPSLGCLPGLSLAVLYLQGKREDADCLVVDPLWLLHSRWALWVQGFS